MSETEISEGEEGQFVPFVPARLHKRSPIHNYFVFNKTRNISVCRSCKTELTGKNSTNLINQLKRPKHIKEEYVKYLKEVSDREEATSSKKSKVSKEGKRPDTKQQTLHQVNHLK